VPNNTFYLYLATPQGLSGPFIQNVGTSVSSGAGFRRNEFSKDGTKLFSSTTTGLIELYDFNRCTGIISTPTIISQYSLAAPVKSFWSLAVSPDKSKMYVTTTNTGATSDSSFLIQFDLNSSNILGTSDTLFALKRPQEFANMQIGPDNKLYICTWYTAADGCFDYLYCDSTRNQTNLNLSVVNYPDSLGAACDFQPFSFYLGGKRAYCGLPNNPNYELGPLLGSSCDTLTVGIAENPMYSNNIIVYYDGDWETAFINAKNLRGKHFKFELFNINGQLIKQEEGQLNSEFYTQNLNMSSYADNIYIVRLITEKEVLTTRFVKR
jgi:WD40 repeat protein